MRISDNPGRSVKMKIRKSTLQDLDRIMEIYAYAREFMAAHGNPNQWGPTNWPPEALIRKDIANGSSYACVNDAGSIIGTFFFIQGADIEPTYRKITNGAWLDDSPYGVVHRIASDGSEKGTGAFCLNWAYSQCGHLRIDTHGDNTVMQGLLKKLGFVHCGTIYVEEDNDPRLAYERSDTIRRSDGKDLTIYFAPMEGMTDGILRRTHNRIFGGVDVYCLPFHKLTQSLSLLTREERDISPEENEGLSILPQALTRDPGQLSAWLYYVSECGWSRADLNLGCPSPTVTKRGRGSGLLRDPGYLRSFMDQLFANTLPVSLSVKTRIGYDSPEEWPELLSLLADYPLAHVTVHVRTTKEQYSGPVHPEAFELALEKGLPHPVYNGDLRTPEDVHSLLSRCPRTEAVMIGRGLLADPALARRIRGGAEASKEELEAWYTSLYEGWKDRFGTTIALGRIKKLMEWPTGDDIRRKRLLRRANDIGGCIDAVINL